MRSRFEITVDLMLEISRYDGVYTHLLIKVNAIQSIVDSMIEALMKEGFVEIKEVKKGVLRPSYGLTMKGWKTLNDYLDVRMRLEPVYMPRAEVIVYDIRRDV